MLFLFFLGFLLAISFFVYFNRDGNKMDSKTNKFIKNFEKNIKKDLKYQKVNQTVIKSIKSFGDFIILFQNGSYGKYYNEFDVLDSSVENETKFLYAGLDGKICTLALRMMIDFLKQTISNFSPTKVDSEFFCISLYDDKNILFLAFSLQYKNNLISMNHIACFIR
jgi:hypothetical protein